METKRLQKMFVSGVSLFILGNILEMGNILEVERNVVVILMVVGLALVIGSIIPLVTEKYSTE
ncbi:MAG TPA: hypothetical protein HA275_02665 [Halobacteriales archaeon]|uniref:hypothetical protein n=1 Tax=Candidatus Hikarchaeum yamanae TaxID=2675326 RepID=UPI0017CB0FA4|nr:hypothetical protein [Halobacteriales archaeon]